MNYFREKLLTYSTERQISTLLHIHVETDKVKPVIPISKAKNYVDEVLTQYSVKMYSYPDLTPSDTKLAINLHKQQKMCYNIFHLEEFKRKPLKKKISKRSINSSFRSQNYKICPCCDTKVFSKHKCQHNLCQKPCARVKNYKFIGINQAGSQSKKKLLDEQEQFTPDKYELDNDQSKSSNSYQRQSDFQQQIGAIQHSQQSESFLSNLDKSRRGKPRRKFGKKEHQMNRKRGGRDSLRRSLRNDIKKNEEQLKQEVNEGQKQKVQLKQDIKKNQFIQQVQNIKSNQQIKIQAQLKQQIKKQPQKRKKGMGGRPKKISTPSQKNMESELEHLQTPKIDGRKRRRGPFFKKLNPQNSQNINLNQNIFENNKFKKRSTINFCTLQELKSFQLFNYTFHYDQIILQSSKQFNSIQKTRQTNRQTNEDISKEKQHQKQVNVQIGQKIVNTQFIKIPEIQNQLQNNKVSQNQKNINNDQNKQQNEEPPINSFLDSVSDQEAENLFNDEILQ